jgi:hypothetical protein
MATALCAAAIRRSHARFPAASAASVLARLVAHTPEASAALLEHRQPSRRALQDVRALRGWRARTAYLAGHLFPPADYMRRRYAPDSRAPLAWLYAARILRGAPRWLRPAR